MIKLLSSISAVEAFWEVHQALPAKLLHLGMCAPSFPPAPRAHTQLTDTLVQAANAPGHLLLPKIRGDFPQVRQPHLAVMKRQIINILYCIPNAFVLTRSTRKQSV